MNHQKIIELSREAGLSFVPEANSPLVKIVMRAVEMEREACAQLSDDMGGIAACSQAIRARGVHL